MKYITMLLFFMLSTLSADFTKAATITPQLLQDGAKKEWCSVCGMSLRDYYKTSHAAKLEDGTTHQYCSIRCLAVDEQEYKLKDIQVVDVVSQKFIPASSAFYVIGSEIKGTMSRVSKLAFLNEDDADDFAMDYNGKMGDFTLAFAMAKDSLKDDIEMAQSKKQKQVYPMGKKIFEKKCKKDIDLNEFKTINELKANLDKSCKNLKDKEFQPLSLYLFEVKRLEGVKKRIVFSKDDKCPVCGMFVYKYPKWAAQIVYKDNKFSFDGVKDMMKYYFLHKDNIKEMLVSNYYTLEAIDAKDAYYVIGSDVYGPMGDELIPFSSEDEARSFSLDHKGKKVLKFDDITSEILKSLDV